MADSQLIQKYNALKALKAQNDDATSDANLDAELDSPIYEGLINGQNNPNVMQTGQTVIDPSNTMQQHIPGWINPVGPNITQFLPDQSQSVPLRDPMARTTTPQESADKDIADYEQAMKIQKEDLGNGMRMATMEPKGQIANSKNPNLAPSESSQAMTRLAAVKDEAIPEEEKTSSDDKNKEPSEKPVKELSDKSSDNEEEPKTKKQFTLSELKAKQDAARQSASIMAGQIQAAASAAAITGRPMDTSGFKAQMALDLSEASDYEKLIEEQRTETSQDIVNEGRKVSNEKATLELGDAEKTADKDSDVSKAGRQTFIEVMKLMGADINPEAIKDLSYDQLEEKASWIEKAMANRNTNEARKEVAQMRRDAAIDKKEEKERSDKVKYNFSTGQALEQIRGSPAVQQAEKDVYAAGKVTELYDRFKGNPNPQMTSLLVSEVAKLGTGQAPTLEGMRALTPDVVASRLAGVIQKVTSSPTPANVKEFLKQYRDYAMGVSKLAKKTITDRYDRVLETRKKYLDPDDYDTLNQKYIKRFDDVLPEETEGTPESDVVKMKLPDGQTVNIPSKNVKAAKAKGAVEAP